jgi:MSHA pilin protein MshD
MNTGQMMITLGAMMILGMVILRVNNGFLSTNTVLLDAKLGVLAVSLATSVIEEATGKAFDAETDTNSVNNLTDLTSATSLGPGTGEVYPNFNDFDDFNGLVYVNNTMPSAIFKIECFVGYINPGNPEIIVSTRTWHKKLTVQVTSKSMKDTVRMSAINSYFYFR